MSPCTKTLLPSVIYVKKTNKTQNIMTDNQIEKLLGE